MENSEEGDIKLNVLEEDYDEMVVQRADVMENVGKKVKIYYDFIYIYIYIYIYNIAFVNSERWLAKSRVDITLSTRKISRHSFVKVLCAIL